MLLHQLWQVGLSFPLGITVALPFKEDFQLLVVQNVETRRWRQRVLHTESIYGGGAGTGMVSEAVWNWTHSHRKSADGHH